MTEKQSLFLQEHWCGLNWSSWVSFASSSQDFRQFAVSQGLYRVRIESQETLAYIGQTGRSLRERVRTLANKTQQDSSPWNDPHTAAACLWAWKKEEDVSYSVSVAVTALSTVDRQCLEDQLLFRYRQEKGRSTLANHGHFHPKWIRPSSKSKGRSMQKHLSPVEEVRSL